MAHPSLNARYTYAGEAESPDGKAYVIDVKNDDGFAARLFIDEKTHLPLMVTYQGPQPQVVTAGRPMTGGGSPPPAQAQPRQMSPRRREEARGRARGQAEQMRSSRRSWSSTRCSSTTGARWTASSSRTRLRRASGGATTEEWSDQQGEGQPEDRPEEVRDGTLRERWTRDVSEVVGVRRRSERAGAQLACAGAATANDRHSPHRRARSERRRDSRRGRADQRSGSADRVRIPEEVASDGQGVAVAAGLGPGRYGVSVSFPGFETLTLPDVRVRAGETKRDVTLAIQKLDQPCRSAATRPVRVRSEQRSLQHRPVEGPDRRAARRSRRNGERAEGDGGPRRDDPRGRLPRRQAAAEVADPFDPLLPRHVCGGEPRRRHGLRRHRHAARPRAAARQPRFHVPRRRAERAERVRGREGTRADAAVQLQPERHAAQGAHVVLAVGGRGVALRLGEHLCCGTGRHGQLECAAAVGPHQLQWTRRSRADQGAHAAADLPAERERTGESRRRQASTCPSARTRDRSDDRLLRLSESGPWAGMCSPNRGCSSAGCQTASTPPIELPTVRVLDAFTAGGAQQAGGRQSTELEWATNVDWAKGKHAVRVGTLVEGGSYRSDNRTNYLGTFTFASLADYDAGRPANYTRRIGDPLVEYSHWQAGLFIQDDWRARKNLTLSGGLRQEFQTHLDDRWNLAPRAGFTWSPFKNGKTTIRGGGGIFYDWLDAGHLRADAARRRRPPADLVDPQPRLSGSIQRRGPARRCCRRASTCSPTTRHADARDGATSG